jgi:hypothetical protein
VRIIDECQGNRSSEGERDNDIAADVVGETFGDEPEDSWDKTVSNRSETMDEIHLIKQDLERVKDEMQKSLVDINEEMIRTREAMKAILLSSSITH